MNFIKNLIAGDCSITLDKIMEKLLSDKNLNISVAFKDQ